MSERILVVEDEEAITDSMAYALHGEGYEVDVADSGETALRRMAEQRYDLLILDLMLPGISGLELCRRIRRSNGVPILMLTARTAEVDMVLGLESGADDYVAKPFSMPELISRVRAILRRRDLDLADAAGDIRHVAGLELDPMRQSVAVDGSSADLTQSEFKLLLLLARDPGRVFTRRELAQDFWDTAFVADARTIDAHIANLRQKIERDPRRPSRLLTVRGVGYTLSADVKEPSQTPR